MTPGHRLDYNLLEFLLIRRTAFDRHGNLNFHSVRLGGASDHPAEVGRLAADGGDNLVGKTIHAPAPLLLVSSPYSHGLIAEPNILKTCWAIP